MSCIELLYLLFAKDPQSRNVWRVRGGETLLKLINLNPRRSTEIYTSSR